jgi:carboxyl-terminal processing protease
LAELIDISIVRDNITVKSVRSRYLGDGFGYVRLSQFMEKTSDDLEKELKRISTAAKRDSLDKIKGLVIDVRNNPGGLLTEAVRVSDLFLKEGVIVYTDGRVEGQKQKFFAHARGTQDDYPIIVLINGGSASAAEILSGSLKDHGRALLLGTQTFGKGSVQTVMPLENGGAVTLTTALYYTKSGRSIQADGVSPDIEMEVIPEEDFKRNGGQAPELIRESDLPGAISVPGITDKTKGRDLNKIPVVQGNLAGINPEKIELSEWYSRDPQLQRAVELLRTFDVFGAKEFVSFGEEEGAGIVG